ncbi:MAG: hypothetical protein Q9165_005334 [Trypethelium subeluteriae]
MSIKECWNLWGTQGRWDDPFLHVVEFPIAASTEEPSAHFDRWFSDIAESSPEKALQSALQSIHRAVEGFKRNVQDCRTALEEHFKESDRTISSGNDEVSESRHHPTTRPTWQCRLFPLFKLVVLQHLDLFDLFCTWAKKKLDDSAVFQNLHRWLEGVSTMNKEIRGALAEKAFVWQDHDHPELQDDFQFLKGKWICRSVLEITLLILRCHKKGKTHKQSNTADRHLPRIEREENSLRSFLKTLKYRETWKNQNENQEENQEENQKENRKENRKERETNVPCVPKVVCFDETSQAIGATRPSWDVGKGGKMKWNPWVFDGKTDFFTASRDSRIPRQVREHHFNPARDTFDRLALFKNVFDKADPNASWRLQELRTQFGREYFGPLRRYEQHVQQAIEGHTGALSDFADYVQKQQSLRRPPTQAQETDYLHKQKSSKHPPVQTETDSGYGTGPGTATSSIITSEHAELDIIDSLGLAEESSHVRLRHLLLDQSADADESQSLLTGYLNGRLEEGHNETLFDLGLEDNGDLMGFTLEDWKFSLARIKQTAEGIGADCRVLATRGVGGEEEIDGERKGKEKGIYGKLIIRRRPESVDDVIETRIAVVGNVDAGKSTLLGVLVKGGLDDGRGKARVNLFRHKHEIESGRTSSVGMEIMGFDSRGDIVTSAVPGRKLSWEEIGNRSAKVISFTDLAGHEKYLRTTVFGLLSSEPNYCLLMVAANNGLIGMSKEHLGIALALNVPVMVVITKIDICPPQILQDTISTLTKILKSPGARKIPIFINNREECIETATQFVSRRICPVFQVSNVTGQSLDLVRTFLNILPHHGHYDSEAPFEFHVNDTFSVPFVGTVVSGVVKSGIIHTGDTILIGPDSLGQFTTTSIRSIERKRIPVPACSAGQSASFALKRVRRKDVRKGMVVLHKLTPDMVPKVYREFVAEVLILSHATTIKTRYQAMLHVGPVSQTCSIIDIDRGYIRTGDRAMVAFRFVQRPEYLAVGDRILFREGRTKGLGIVKSLGYDEKKPLNPDLANGTEKGKGKA